MLRALTALSGLRPLAGLLAPFFMLFSVACSRSSSPGPEPRALERYALRLDTPAGWTGGVAGGTYEYHSPDGLGRVRVGRLEGATGVAGLKDVQLMAGTGASPSARIAAPSPTKVGPLPALRARFSGGDGRVYDVVAVQLPGAPGAPPSVVLVQTSVTADYAAEHNAAVESLFALVRQSLRYEGAAPAAASALPLAAPAPTLAPRRGRLPPRRPRPGAAQTSTPAPPPLRPSSRRGRVSLRPGAAASAFAPAPPPRPYAPRRRGRRRARATRRSSGPGSHGPCSRRSSAIRACRAQTTEPRVRRRRGGARGAPPSAGRPLRRG
ncbi:MAG TPA: hypothetical protein VFS43_46305 [Polyangiaceae bacterium]|nr:hypothetical protein [Polyangiaceae bacterium]